MPIRNIQRPFKFFQFDDSLFMFQISTAQKVSLFGVILVRIFPAFSRIGTEYREIRSISPYSVRMRKNTGKM